MRYKTVAGPCRAASASSSSHVMHNIIDLCGLLPAMRLHFDVSLVPSASHSQFWSWEFVILERILHCLLCLCFDTRSPGIGQKLSGYLHVKSLYHIFLDRASCVTLQVCRLLSATASLVVFVLTQRHTCHRSEVIFWFVFSRGVHAGAVH